MTLQNFTLDIDADGIALVTWNMPGRSMNVIDAKVGRGAFVDRREGHNRRRHQGRRDHLGQGHVLRRRRPQHAGDAESRLCRAEEIAGRGGGECPLVRGCAQPLADLPAHRDLRQAVGGGDHRHRDGRRLRARARLPSSRRRRQRQGAARPAGDQGRTIPRRRRHAARRANAAAGRCAAIPAQRRPHRLQPRQGHEAHRRGGPGSRPRAHGQGLDQGRRHRQAALGHRRLQIARRAGLFESRSDRVHAGERTLSPRNLRQLSRRARHHAGRL